ncbi:IS1182 family transposase [Cereibacter azotoformans]|nr:IS1182 family transposase [Cereibacter azotoformans]UIJ32276.1 IS1182 family transposase [Cereibacter azotoformans]
MAGFIEGVERSQTVLFPDRLEDWMSEDALVRVVDLFVDELDLAELGFVRSAAARTGRPGYHPAVLLKLFIYGYLNRIPSSRRLEREAGRNVEVMWLTGKLVPDHKTIADFRRDNAAAIRKTCAQFVELCRRIGVLKGDCVAIDGSKFKAVNNRDRNFTKGKIASRLTHLEADVARCINEMVRIDRQEEGEARAEKVAHLARRYGRIRREIERLKAMDKALADAPDGQISLTDPDARAMATSARNSGLVGYNAQCAVDAETHLIVTHDVTNHGFDRDQLSPMATAAREALGHDDLHAIADKGYFSGTEILACHEAGITTTVPRPMTSGNEAKGMFVKTDFLYDPARDIYTCPAGNGLTYRGTREEGGLQVRRYWINDCQTCPIQRRCTSGTERRITRWEHEHLIDAMRERRARDPDPMTLRRCTVEHVFGTLKAWMGTTHFLTRRLKNVRTEMALNVLAYNMKRMISLIGARRLMEAIPG